MSEGAGGRVRSPTAKRAFKAHQGFSSERDAGNATAELAVSLPALALLIAVGITALTAVRTQIECVDAAREAARAAARGDAVPPVEGGSVMVTTDGDVVISTVIVRWHPGGDLLPGFDIRATSVAAVEPS